MKKCLFFMIIMAGLLGGLASGAPSSYIELQWYDRPIADPPLHILEPRPGYIVVGKEVTQADFFYRVRTEIHLEFTPVEEWPWLSALVRTEIRVRGAAANDLGHFYPISADLGAGAVARLGQLDITLLLSSKHGTTVGYYNTAYDSITVRRNL